MASSGSWKYFITGSKENSGLFGGQKEYVSASNTLRNQAGMFPKHCKDEYSAWVCMSEAEASKANNRLEEECTRYIEAGRILFDKCIEDIRLGRGISFESYTDAIHAYESAIETLEQKGRTRMAGCITLEMANYLKRISKFEDSILKFIRAADILSLFPDLKLASLWQGTCCLMYLNEWSRVQDIITQSLLPLAAKISPLVHSDLTLTSLLVRTILDPTYSVLDECESTTVGSNICGGQYEVEQKKILVKGLCSAYIEGNAEAFRELQSTLTHILTHEQQYIMSVMCLRCENPGTTTLLGENTFAST